MIVVGRGILVVVLLEPDLVFSSKIEAVARKVGLECRTLTNVGDLIETMRVEAPRVLILNLDFFGQQFEVLRELSKRNSLLFGYYSHVNSELAKTARNAGIIALSRATVIRRLESSLETLREESQ